MRWIPIFALLIGCGSSHTAGDGGHDGSSLGCEGAAPTGCAEPGEEPGCCDPVPASCIDGAWSCPDPSSIGWSCETFDCGGTSTCRGPIPTCFENLGGGCCGEEVPAQCAPPFEWRCGGDQLRAFECDPLCEPPACGELSHLACVEAEACAPVYEDTCCPSCEPGPCADCARFEFHHCAPVDAVCASDPPATCGRPAPWECTSPAEDCSAASAVDREVCDVPGCITRWAIDTPDFFLCAPVRADMCAASCDIVPPDCGPDAIAEAEGDCYSGFCIAASVCAP